MSRQYQGISKQQRLKIARDLVSETVTPEEISDEYGISAETQVRCLVAYIVGSLVPSMDAAQPSSPEHRDFVNGLLDESATLASRRATRRNLGKQGARAKRDEAEQRYYDALRGQFEENENALDDDETITVLDFKRSNIPELQQRDYEWIKKWIRTLRHYRNIAAEIHQQQPDLDVAEFVERISQRTPELRKRYHRDPQWIEKNLDRLLWLANTTRQLT